jgi:hypothetical protein
MNTEQLAGQSAQPCILSCLPSSAAADGLRSHGLARGVLQLPVNCILACWRDCHASRRQLAQGMLSHPPLSARVPSPKQICSSAAVSAHFCSAGAQRQGWPEAGAQLLSADDAAHDCDEGDDYADDYEDDPEVS